MRRLLVLTLALPAFAGARELTDHPDWMLEPVPGTYTQNGIGAPTVAYDAGSDTWVMFFESRLPETRVGCTQGVWGVGRATSRDGLAWTLDPDPILVPTEGTFSECVIAHPVTVFDGQTWHLWFKAQQRADACADTAADAPWGCEVVTGVGYATSTDGVHFTPREQPVIALGSFGFPAVARVDGEWRMLLAYSNAANRIYELWESVSTDGTTWSIPTSVLQPGGADWMRDEVYNPALVCEDDPDLPYTLFLGGRKTQATSSGGVWSVQVLEAGIGMASSPNGVDWTLTPDSPLRLWDLSLTRDWRHWDAVRVGEDYLVYFAEKDGSDRNRVGLAYTFPDVQGGFDEGQVASRVCDFQLVQPETDTDLPPDTTDTDTTDPPEEEETPTGRSGTAGGGTCGCASGGSSGVVALPLLLVGLRRQRRAWRA